MLAVMFVVHRLTLNILYYKTYDYKILFNTDVDKKIRKT